MLKLEKGMIVQLLEDTIYYYHHTFESTTIPKGTFGEIVYIGIVLPENIDIPPIPTVAVKCNDIKLFYCGEMIEKFRRIYKVAIDTPKQTV
jgi:hypothetical protein